MKNLGLFLLVVLILSSSSIMGQSLSLDHIDGYNETAIKADGVSTSVFYIRITNNNDPHGAITNGFKIYSPNGVEWTQSNLDTLSWGWSDMFNLKFSILNNNVDGVGMDTMGVGGARMTTAGLPPRI